ncbi:hypothetical protein K469DRAFT_686873 [Zopfia rhizophila CBS 207.26]|uniref:Uncharacterized protein n=1 Tax=Zopfia rhizophila CBS 207.26 TaxID=1314779 RepID=A0A6A6E7L1_9PEZI|nr:hypothetical protein K469DRAFT_686873 [Zopfia rhizophila CBS 207.26]
MPGNVQCSNFKRTAWWWKYGAPIDRPTDEERRQLKEKERHWLCKACQLKGDHEEEPSLNQSQEAWDEAELEVDTIEEIFGGNEVQLFKENYCLAELADQEMLMAETQDY